MLGEHQRLSAVPGAVAISSVPRPHPTLRDRRGVKLSLHWLLDTWDEEKRPLTVPSIASYTSIQRLAGSSLVPGNVAKNKPGSTTGIRKVHAHTTVTFVTAQIECFCRALPPNHL